MKLKGIALFEQQYEKGIHKIGKSFTSGRVSCSYNKYWEEY
jgi:hypothetical protein